MVSFNQEGQNGKMKKMKWWGNYGGVCQVDGLLHDFCYMVAHVETLHRDLIMRIRLRLYTVPFAPSKILRCIQMV